MESKMDIENELSEIILRETHYDIKFAYLPTKYAKALTWIYTYSSDHLSDDSSGRSSDDSYDHLSDYSYGDILHGVREEIERCLDLCVRESDTKRAFRVMELYLNACIFCKCRETVEGRFVWNKQIQCGCDWIHDHSNSEEWKYRYAICGYVQ